MGTKGHKNFDVKSALSRGIFTDKRQLATGIHHEKMNALVE
jgi:hypothetical protein